LRKRNFLGVFIAVAMVASMMLTTVSSAFAADQISLSVSPDKTTASVGDTVTYTYLMANNSTENITNLTLSDNRLGPISLPSAILLPGENITATGSYIVTIADLPGPLGNIAEVSGTLAAGDNIATVASASVAVNPLNPGVMITKSADVSSAVVGDNITYTYIITNSGSSALTGLVLTDSKLGAVPLLTTSLLAGSNINTIRKYTVEESDLPGPLTNTATVVAADPSGATVTATSSQVSVELVSALPASSISIVKNADLSSASIGDNITYTYSIANTGSTKLTGLVLVDSKLGAITLSSNSLDAGGNTAVTQIYKVVASDLPGPLTNTATVNGIDPSGKAVSATSGAVSVLLTPTRTARNAIRVIKKADKLFAQVGDNITYTYTIKNMSQAVLTGLVLTDSKLGAIALSTTSLNAGESTSATRVYMVVKADLPGPLVNTAKVTAVNSAGAAITAVSNKVTVKLIRNWFRNREGDDRTKSEILKDRGVPGKGIDNAPGLQKFFNFWSNAFKNNGDNDRDDKGPKGKNNSNGRGGDKHDN
jgi:uncharacterized repeat protein (TIGR01451 family)